MGLEINTQSLCISIHATKKSSIAVRLLGVPSKNAYIIKKIIWLVSLTVSGINQFTYDLFT
jgi:hypothetical protein